MLPERAILRATALAANTGLMLAIGSSLEVWPVAELPADTLRAGGKLAIVTMGPTPYDAHAVVKLDGDVEEELRGGAGRALRRSVRGVQRAGAQRGLEPRQRRRDRLDLGAVRACPHEPPTPRRRPRGTCVRGALRAARRDHRA